MGDKVIDVQRRSFTKWVNAQLKKGDFDDEVENLEQELRDGIILMKVISVATGCAVPKHNHPCKHEIHRVSNLGIVMDMYKEAKIKLIGIGPTDLESGDVRCALAAVWAIIHAQQLGSIKGEASGKAGLLLWVKRAVGPYGIEVSNFKKSWSSGLALAALLHKHRPTAIVYDEIKELPALEILDKCLTVAESQLQIPALVDAADIEQAIDEKAIMTYISTLFTVFSKEQSAEVTQRRVIKFFENQKVIDTLQTDYEAKSSDIIQFCDEELPVLVDGLCPSSPMQKTMSLKHIKSSLSKLNTFRSSELNEKRIIKESLESIMSNIQTALSTAKRPHYNPPADQSLAVIDLKWSEIEEAANQKLSKLRVSYTEKKKFVCEKYLEGTTQLNTAIKSLSSEVRSATGDDLAKVLEKVQACKETASNLSTGEDDVLSRCLDLAEQLSEAGVSVDDIEGLEGSIEDLQRDYTDLMKLITKKVVFLESQIQSKKNSGVSVEKLAEIKETFNHFDENHNGHLTAEEFTNCLKGLGKDLSDEATAKMFKDNATSKQGMGFDEFVTIMTKMEADADSPDEILASLIELQPEGSEGLTFEELAKTLGEETAAHFAERIPKKESGVFDFKSYIKGIYSNEGIPQKVVKKETEVKKTVKEEDPEKEKTEDKEEKEEKEEDKQEKKEEVKEEKEENDEKEEKTEPEVKEEEKKEKDEKAEEKEEETVKVEKEEKEEDEKAEEKPEKEEEKEKEKKKEEEKDDKAETEEKKEEEQEKDEEKDEKQEEATKDEKTETEEKEEKEE
eukprot:TRINITY_DN3370_c0_g1_i2.p1 TRINITY_DN3370_c0_g1~~TRINITY_DN3370_c0_g1_i2.p1  ORF type:complete len:789 (+),score=267.75 TRINITY_DN3370_c0_g1_i2:86-2452(+)